MGNKIKTILLTGSTSCNVADNNTIGYKTTASNVVNLLTHPSFPSGKHIIATTIEYLYTNALNQIALGNVEGGNLYINTKISSNDVRYGVRIIYRDDD
jgi:hypothetical protein